MGDTQQAKTSDRVAIVPGLRVFTIDWKWGTVTDRPGYEDHPGDWWFDVQYDDRDRPVSLNGERMTTRAPDAAHRDPHPGARARCKHCGGRIAQEPGADLAPEWVHLAEDLGDDLHDYRFCGGDELAGVVAEPV